MNKVKIGLAVFGAFLIVANLVVNLEPVKFTFWVFTPVLEIQVAKTVLILISVALGSLITLGVQWWYRRRGKVVTVAVAEPPAEIGGGKSRVEG